MDIKTIVITYFVNPHKFWWFDANTPTALLSKIADIEKKLPTHAIPKITPPRLLELVVVDFVPWHKHIRGIVINENAIGTGVVNGCHVWAVDYGFPILATPDQLSPLPKECAEEFDFIHYGGIKDLYPFAKSKRWRTATCTAVEEFILDAADVTFVVAYRDARNHFWGDMAFHFAQYKSIFVDSLLIDRLQADHAGRNFQDNCTEMETAKGAIWVGNDFSDRGHINAESNKSRMLQNIANWWAKANKALMPSPEAAKPTTTAPATRRVLIERYQQAMRKRQEEPEKAKNDAAMALTRSIDHTNESSSLSVTSSAEFDSYPNGANNKLDAPNAGLEIATSAQMAQSPTKKNSSLSDRSKKLNKLYEDEICGKIENRTQTEKENKSIQSSNCGTAKDNLETNHKSSTHPLSIQKQQSSQRQGSHPLAKILRMQLSQPSNDLSTPMKQPGQPTIHTESAPQVNSKALPTTPPPTSNAQQPLADHPRLSSAFGRNGRRHLSHPADIPDKLDRILLEAQYERFILGNEEIYSLTQTGVKPPNVKPTRNALGRSELLAKPCKDSKTQGPIPESREYPSHFPDVLLHAEKVLPHVTKIVEADFSAIQEVGLKKNGIREVYNSQAYSWRYIKNAASTVVIGPECSGKTWSYLPALIDLVHAEMKRHTVFKLWGPIAVILVPTAWHIHEMKTLCRQLLDKSYEETIVGAFSERNLPEVDICLMLSCSFLITTPATFVTLLELDDNRPPRENLFDLYRLRYITVDKLHLMQFPDVDAVFSKITELSLRLRNKPEMQYMLTSREWNPALRTVLSDFQNLSIIFADYLEAACYGRTKIYLRMVRSDEKLPQLKKFLTNHHIAHRRTIIFCHDDEEVGLVQSQLDNNNYAYYTPKKAMDEDHTDPDADKLIVVCTDRSFLQLSDSDFDNIVHYWMTNNWMQFTTRFRAIAGKHPDLTKYKFEPDSAVYKSNAFILIDEKTNLQLPALMANLRKFVVKYKKSEWEQMIEVSEQLDSERRFLCDERLQYGKCSDALCGRRHKLLEHEKTFEIDDLPPKGELRIKVLKIHTPTFYSIALKSHKRPEAKNFEEIKSYEGNRALLCGLESHYSKPQNRLPYLSPKEGDVCVYKRDGSSASYQRARIVNAVQRGKRTKITIKLLDTGAVVKEVDPNLLYECDNSFKDIPGQAIDVRLLGVVPVDSERAWDPQAENEICRVLLDEKTEYVQLNYIHFKIANTLFVNDMTFMVKAGIGKDFIPLTSVANLLIQKKYGKKSNTQKDDVCNALDVECM